MLSGESKTFDNEVYGYPHAHLAEVPLGEYNVQALLNVYQTFDFSTGHTVFCRKDIYFGAHVLLPQGYEEHPEGKYPFMIFHRHFSSDFG